jgi:predicted RNA-binding Zn-ribbon protein involved in translation (DUF1610 family)
MGHEKVSQIVEVTCPKCGSKTECRLKWPKGRGYYVCLKCDWDEPAKGICGQPYAKVTYKH